jgi:hypothetical protein
MTEVTEESLREQLQKETEAYEVLEKDIRESDQRLILAKRALDERRGRAAVLRELLEPLEENTPIPEP